MQTVVVTTQAELDALPKGFAVPTVIELRPRMPTKFVVEARENSSVVAWENSSVVAWGNGSVVARENSSVVAWGNSSVVARENSSVVALENSSVVAWENSSVEARENSSVVARGNSSVEARENSSVVARGDSSVVARGNSSVVAWENSSVEARENSSVEARGNSVVRVVSVLVRVALFGFAVAFLPIKLSLKVAINVQSSTAHIQVVTDLDWFERNGVSRGDTITLYKRVSSKWKTQESTPNETTWNIGTTLVHPQWNPAREECGPGKFHACSRPYFCDQFRTIRGDRYIAIKVLLEDVYEWPEPQYPYKIAFRACEVLYECDRFGKRLEATQKTVLSKTT